MYVFAGGSWYDTGLFNLTDLMVIMDLNWRENPQRSQRRLFSGGGDLNGDGYDDLVLSCFKHNNYGSHLCIWGGPNVSKIIGLYRFVALRT